MVFICFIRPYSATAQTKDDLMGDWSTEAPDAPPGFKTSIMKITIDSVFIAFAAEPNQYHSTSMNFENDTFTFMIGGVDALCTLKFEDKTKMKGNAVWPDGESLLFLTKMGGKKPADSRQK